jgi:adenosylcobinamide-phosphate synthase
MPHPVRAIGWLISRQEILWRRSGLPLRIAGVALWIGTVAITTGIVAASLRWLPSPLPAIYWTYSLVAIRDLDLHALTVIEALQGGDLALARQRVSRIVGRDTADLSESEVVRATIETVAENLSDGIVAPLFYLALAGPAAMAAYKAVNTMDSMIGHRDERYRELGWFAARADDVFNWVPARLTSLLVWVVCALPPYSMQEPSQVRTPDIPKLLWLVPSACDWAARIGIGVS